MRVRAIILAVIASAACSLEAQPAGMAEYQKMKYGFFVHYVWGGEAYSATINRDGSKPAGLDDLADRFNVEAFAADLAAMRVQYVLFTAWHANMNALYPSRALEKWLPGHSVKRDLIGDLIQACKARKIAVLLYTHPRDGHDFTPADQARTGWASGKSPDPDWAQFDKKKWNDFINDVYGELVDRYGNDILGLYLDEGSGAGDSYRVLDYPRLRQTITRRHPLLLMMQNHYGNLYTCDLGNQEVFYNGSFANPDGNQWPAYKIPISIVVGSIFWAAFPEGRDTPAQTSDKVGFNKWIHYTPEAMFRYTVLQAGANVDGGGVLWAAGPYPGGGWETGVLDRMTAVGKRVESVAPSIKETYPSTSYPTRPGTCIANLKWGVATQSTDAKKEYLHILTPPEDSKTLRLPPPADGKRFSKASLLATGRAVGFEQTNAGLRLTLPTDESWDPLDTVIVLLAAADSPAPNLALWKPVRASSLDNHKHSATLAADGDPITAWMPASDDKAPACIVDLAQPSVISRVELIGSFPPGTTLQAAEVPQFKAFQTLAKATSTQAMRLEIVKASYGAGVSKTDITEKARSSVRAGALNLKADNTLVAADPAPNRAKALQVEYTLNGAAGTAVAPEGHTLSLGVPNAWVVDLASPVTARFLRLAFSSSQGVSVAEIKALGSVP